MRAFCCLVVLAALAVSSPAEARDREVARAGHVRAALSWIDVDQRITGLRLSIWRRDRLVLREPVPSGWTTDCLSDCIQPMLGRAVVVRDLDGDDDPEVLLRLYGAGAHCCAITRIYSYRPTGFIRHRRVWYAGYRLVDLDRDGLFEFRSANGDFCFSCSYPNVRFPIQIWRYRHARLVDVTRRFPRLVRGDARQWLTAYRAESSEVRRTDGHPLLDAYVADTALLGEARRGWEALRAAGRRGELGRHPRRYERGLRRYLRRTAYVRSERRSQSSRQYG